MRLFDPSPLYADAKTDGNLVWRRATADEANELLAWAHYLGPRDAGGILVFGGFRDSETVACQVWGFPSAAYLPNDGSWLELQRWCLTGAAGANAGSRMHAYVVRWLRRERPEVTTLISYSDPSQGHTGALYKACNWQWAPTWHRLRPPPTGNGRWRADGPQQTVKDRWAFPLRDDACREELLRMKDESLARRMAAT